MAFTDISDILNRLTGGNNGSPEHIFMYIDPTIAGVAATAPVAGQANDLWKYAKSPGANGATPAAVTAPTLSTNGALPFTNAGGGRTKYLVGMGCVANTGGTLILYDRLLQVGGLSGTVTTAQNVGGTLTRNTGGVGNNIYVNINTIIGSTGTTITASYTNQAGAAKTTPAVTIGGTGFREAERIIRLPLADGDTGVQGVTSVTLAASTLTAGDFGVIVAQTLLRVGAGLNVHNLRGLIEEMPGVVAITASACLGLIWQPQTTTTPRILADFHFLEV